MKFKYIIIVLISCVALAFYLSNDGRYNSELMKEYVYWSKVMKANGIDISKSESIRVLDFAELSDDVAGRSNRFSNLIYISHKEREHKPTVRAILWHELGHYTFDLKHDGCVIMNTELAERNYYSTHWSALESEYVNLIINKDGEK